MYESKMAAAIKSNGKVLREFKDIVYIPYGQEYSILLKNLNTVRALVNVYIDGDNAVPSGLVIDAGQEVDLERWIKNGNLTEGNRFKFIERTGAVEQHRGVKLEDGIVRVEFQFELPSRPVQWINTTPTFGYPSYTGNTYNVGGILRNVDYSQGEKSRIVASCATSATLSSMGIATNCASPQGMSTMDSYVSDVGITVPGSHSKQQFQTAFIGTLETTKHSMVFKLLGQTDNAAVAEPVTVKHKPRCTTCGKQNKATAKFCSSCGTALEIFA